MNSTALANARADLGLSMAGLASVAAPTEDPQDLQLTKLNTLVEAKQQKLNNLGNAKLSNIVDGMLYDPSTVGSSSGGPIKNNDNLSATTTVLPDGQKESNANKIWNDLSHEELQAKIGDTLGNYALQTDPKTGGQYYYQPDENGNQTRVDYDGKARRFYSYNTKEAGSDVVKFGLSTDKYASSDARYSPLTGWLPGPKGVDTKKNLVDVLLPYDKATELEALIHGNSGALAQRVVKSDDLAGRKAYGSGASEYYSSIDNVLGDVSQSDLSNVVAKDFIGANSARLEPAVTGDNFMSLKRAGNIAKAPAAMASKWLLDTAAAVTGLVSDKAADAVFGTSDERAKGIHKLVGYDSRYSQEHLNVISKMVAANMGQEIAESDKGWFDRAVEDYKGWGSTQIQAMNRLVSNLDGEEFGRIITESLKSPETAVEFYGVIALETLGAKGAGLATKAGKAEKMIAGINADSKLSTADKLAKIAKVEEVSGITNVNKLALTAAQQSPIALLAFGQTKVQEEDFVKNTGRKYTPEEALGVTMMNILSFKLEKAVDMEQLKGVQGVASAAERVLSKLPDNVAGNVASSLLKNSARLVAGATEESAQELVQGYMEELNKYNLYGDDAKPMTKIQEIDMANKAATGMLAAIGSTGIMQSPSIVKDLVSNTKLGSKIADKMTSSKETKTNAPTVDESRPEASPEDKTHMVNVLEALDDDKFDYTANTKGTLEDINRAEDTLSRITKTNDNAEIIADAESRLSSAKARALKLVDNSDAEDFRLGSREDAEALLEFTLENSSKEEVVSRDAKMMKIAEQFGLEKEYKHLKDYYSVEKEAVEGDRGYKGYEKQLKVILASDKPDTKEVTKIVKRLQNYYQQENSYVQALAAGIKEAEAIASAHNRNATLGKPAQYEVTIPGQKVNKPWKINFEEVNGKYVVPAVTHNMLETKKRNVDGIVRALAEGGSKAKTKKLEVNTGTSLGITIPMATTGKAKNVEELNKYREMDANRYDKLGVTKVILGLKHDKKWDIYRKLNESKINQGVYTKDDVVVLNITALEVNGKKVSLDTSTAREVKAAMKAGATIVIDSGIYGKDTKGKGAGKLHTQLTLLLSRYTSPDNKYGIVAKADGNTKGSHVFKPKEVADVENIKAIETKKIDKEAKATKQKALDALVLAIANGEDTKELVIEAAKYFSSSKDGTSAKQNALIHANNVLSKEIEAGAVEWYDVVKEEYGADATDADIHDMLDNKEGAIKLEAPIGGHKTISSAAIKAKVVERVVELFNVRREALQLMTEWKQLVEEQRIGDKDVKDLPKWLASKGYEAKEAFDLSESIAKGLEAVKVKLDADGKQIAVKRGKQSLKDGELLQTLELDTTKIMQISKTTVLNTIDLDTIFKTAPELEREVNSAIASIEKAINLDGLRDSTRAEDAAKDKMTKQEFILKDAPGLALLLTSDGKVNKQTVTAIVLALYNGYQNDGYMLNGKPKSNEDVAAMLGMRAAELPKGAAKLVAEKGMLTKSFATDLRKDIANLLGISRISDEGEARRFDQAMTDLAQVAIMVGVDKDILVLDDEMTTADYAEKVLGLDKNEVYTEKGTTVSFIRLSTPTAVEDMHTSYKELVADLPMEDSYRNDVRFNKPSDKEIERVLEGIKNDLSGGKIPEVAKKLLRKGMKAEHIVNTAMIKDLLQPEYVDLIKDRMGWIAISTQKTPNAKYDALSKDKKDIQEAINRDVEKEIAELTRVVEMTDKEEMSLYFMMYYTKNGRYMYDSNTLNPQTNKQLTRWLIQPKDHQNEVSYEDGKFVVDGKDATDAYMFALGQAFGYGVDKKNFKNTKLIVGEIVTTLMDKDNKQLDTLFKDMLANEDVAVGDRKVEIEHIAHAHQAIAMLKELKADGKTTSSLTAEIDAKTSGFGIKTALMPIIGKVQDYLAKVGIVIGSKDKPAVTINSLLDPDSGNKMLDVYQGLGTGMQRIALKDVDKDQKSVMGGNLIINNKDKFSGLVNVLPTIKEGKDIPTAIRNLFKQPFMEFNYSAGLRSIRRSLALELAHKAAEQGMKSEKDFKELGLDKITGMRYEQFEQEMLDTNLEKIKIDAFGGKGLELVLATAMDLMYGTQIEATFQREFAPAIQAQGVINQAYQAMFKMFAEVYKVRLAKLRADNDGVVTVVQYKKLMTDLRKMFPTVKGPLSEGYEDSVAIYSTKTGTAKDVESGAPASQVHINKTWAKKNGLVASFGTGNSTHTLQYEIKKFEQAMSAGSVIPIHYFDGALMALTAEEITTDLTMIHDAIMPKLTELFTTAKSYNKSMYEKTLGEGRYKIIDELLASLVSVKKEVEAELGNEVFDGKEVKVIKRTLNDDITKTADAETLKLDEYLELTEDEVKTLASSIDTAFTAIKNDIDKYGVAVSHLVAGAEEGTYVVDGQEKAESSLKQAKTKENSGKITAEYISKELPQLSVEQVEELVQLLKELPVEAAEASIDKLRHCI